VKVYISYVKKTSHKHISQAMIAFQAGIFKALASPIRLAIVSLLYTGDMAVNDITEALEQLNIPKTSDRTNVCKNLALLRKLHIVTVRKQRQQRIYSLLARCLVDAMQCTLDVITMQRKLEGMPIAETK
jgi:DNA-binding transcriptional ArsR family regulator